MSIKDKVAGKRAEDAKQPPAQDKSEAHYQKRVEEIEKQSGSPLSDYSKFLLHRALWDSHTADH